MLLIVLTYHNEYDEIFQGQIGDDAYFTARHVDDWTNGGTSAGRAVTIPSADNTATSYETHNASP